MAIAHWPPQLHSPFGGYSIVAVAHIVMLKPFRQLRRRAALAKKRKHQVSRGNGIA